MYYEAQADEKYHLHFWHIIGSVNTPPHFHDSVEMFFMLSGSCEACVNGVSKTIKKGDLVFVDGYDIHSFASDNMQGYSVVISKTFLNLFTELNGAFDTFLRVDGENFDNLASYLKENYVGTHFKNPFLAQSFACGFTGRLIELFDLKAKIENKHKNLIVEIMQYINNNFRLDISVGTVAKEFGYSENYLSAVFKKFAKFGFCDYLNYVRLLAVKEALLRGELTLTEAVLDCGFGSLNTYYRAKNRFTPAAETIKS